MHRTKSAFAHAVPLLIPAAWAKTPAGQTLDRSAVQAILPTLPAG